MSRPESVSSSTARRGSSIAICRISLRFFSPPEKPTLTARRSISWLDAEMGRGLAHPLHEIRRREFALAARLALRVERGAQERHGGDARHFDRILERQEQALGGALVRRHAENALAVEQHVALGDFVVVLAGQHIGERRLARAVRPHDGRDLALLDGQRQAVEDFLVLDLDMQIFDFQQCHVLVLTNLKRSFRFSARPGPCPNASAIRRRCAGG